MIFMNHCVVTNISVTHLTTNWLLVYQYLLICILNIIILNITVFQNVLLFNCYCNYTLFKNVGYFLS